MKVFKKIILLVVAMMVIGCAGTMPVNEPGVPIEGCTPEQQVLRMEFDHEGKALVWIDIDCDGVCDGAVLVMTTEDDKIIPIAEMSCEQATHVHTEYMKQKNQINASK